MWKPRHFFSLLNQRNKWGKWNPRTRSPRQQGLRLWAQYTLCFSLHWYPWTWQFWLQCNDVGLGWICLFDESWAYFLPSGVWLSVGHISTGNWFQTSQIHGPSRALDGVMFAHKPSTSAHRLPPGVPGIMPTYHIIHAMWYSTLHVANSRFAFWSIPECCFDLFLCVVGWILRWGTHN